MNKENKIYLQILELIEKEYDAKQSKQNYIVEEDIEFYNGKREITKEEIAKYFGNYKNINEVKKKGIQYYSKLPKEIKEYIKHCSKEVRQAIGFALIGKPVKILTGKEFQKDGIKLTIKVPKYYKEKYGGKVINKELGKVSLDLESVKDDIAHGIGSLKASAFIAVPEVIMYGKIFDRQKNWKNRCWDTFVIIAPIKIGDRRYIEEIIIKKDSHRQGLYLHEIEIKKRLEDFIKTYADENHPLGHPPISKLIIAKKI
jgi:hypothetical protein